MHVAQLASAMACIMRAKAKCPKVSAGRYEELIAPHRFLLGRRRAAEAGLDENDDDSMRRLTGYRREAVLHGSMSTWGALKLQRIADHKKRNAPDCDPMADYWDAAKRYGARAMNVGNTGSGPTSLSGSACPAAHHAGGRRRNA